ncbi:MAG: metallophosphoesterase [Candidatus Methanoperedens sp.]
MRILLFSDISWAHKPKNQLEFIKNKISKIKPSLILIAGDVIGEDKIIYLVEFLDLLQFLDKEKITTFFIQGNHDEVPDYESLLREIKSLYYIKEISNKIIEFDGIKILGLPYSFTNNLNNVRKINEIYPEQVDIILAHSAYGRRIWLFKLKPKLIITGHYRVQICKIFDTVLVGSDGFPNNYSIIDYEAAELTITYFRKKISEVQFKRKCIYGEDSKLIQNTQMLVDSGIISLEDLINGNMTIYQKTSIITEEEYVSQAKLINGKLVWKMDEHQVDKGLFRSYLEPLKDSKYGSKAENLITAKKKIYGADLNKQEEIKKDLFRIGIKKTTIKEYLGI